VTITVALRRLAGASDNLPVLVVGPSLGTSAATLWTAAADALGDSLRVLAWDLPGHGGAPATTEAYTVADLATALAAAVERLDEPGVHYAGDSLGAAVGLQLALDRPDLVRTATLCCTGARIGAAESWADRARTVRAEGTASIADASADRWFAPGFADRDPDTAQDLLQALRDTDDESYALACEALAGFDLRGSLHAVRAPVLAVAGQDDAVTPVESLRAIAAGVVDGALSIVPDAAHLVPAEQPQELATLIASHALRPRTEAELHAAGAAVRREVLGGAHVDRAGVGRIGQEFQSFITRYAWGSIWTRPGLARRDRSLITLAALVAGGHHEELALHLRAARRNGLSEREIIETLLQTAIYCGVPAANTAFRIAEQVLGETDGETDDPAATTR